MYFQSYRVFDEFATLPETATAGTVVAAGTRMVATGGWTGVPLCSSSFRVGVGGAGVA